MARGPVHFGAPHLVFAAAAVAVSVLFWRSTVKTGCETGLLCKRIFFGLGNGDTFGHTGNGRAGTMPEIDFQSVEFIGDSWSRRRDLNPRPSDYKSFQASMTDCDRGILSLQVPAIPALSGQVTAMVWYGQFSAVPKEIPTVTVRDPQRPAHCGLYQPPVPRPCPFRQKGPKYPPQGPALAPPSEATPPPDVHRAVLGRAGVAWQGV